MDFCFFNELTLCNMNSALLLLTTASDLLVGMLLIENFFFNNFSYFHLFQSFHLISLTSVLSDSGTDGPWNLCLELEFREQGDSKFGK